MKKTALWITTAALILILLTVFTVSVCAEGTVYEGVCGNELTWKLNTDTGELIVEGNGAMPSYGGSAGNAPWYEYRQSIRTLTVMDGVSSIGDYAFFNCNSLAEVYLPSSLTAIGAYAFSGCRALSTLDIPDGVCIIGTYALSGCTGLESILLPEGITAIPDALFSGCVKLRSVTLPNGVTAIGDNAFFGCRSLTEQSIPMGVTSIGAGAFQMCSKLETVILPNTLTEIGDLAFDGTALELALYYGTEDEWQKTAVGDSNSVLTDALMLHPDHAYTRELADPIYLKSEADCENAETYYKSCACGAVGTETFTYGSAWGHMGGAATCTEQAICTVCWQPYGELNDHTPDGEADCTHAQHCTVCGLLLAEALGHDYETAVTPPSCTEEGYTTHTCVRCEDDYVDTVVPATGHTDGVEATCTTAQTCTVCGEVLAEAMGHDHVAAVTVVPTCTEEGKMTYTCTRCADSYEMSLAPAGHTHGVEATCTVPQTCTVCGTVLADALGHTYHAVTVEATCTEQGYTAHTCSRCHVTYLDTYTAATGHAPGEAATCTANQTCTVCGTLLAEKTGHRYEDVAVEPTCAEAGYTVHTCSVCATAYLDTDTAPIGHTPGDEATCTAAQVCTVCNTVLADRQGHDYTESVVVPTCTEEGYTVHRCTRCENTYIDSVVPAMGHTVGDTVTDRPPAFGEAGKKHTECAVCQAVLESETFWDEETSANATSSDGSESTTPHTVESHSDEDDSQSGCGHTMANILVVVLILVAVFLFWFIDSRRRG